MDRAHSIFKLLKARLATLKYPHTRSKLGYGSVNVNCFQWDIVHMCMAASLYPNLCRVEFNEHRNGLRELRTRFGELAYPLLSVVREEGYKIDTFVVYDEKNITAKGPVIKTAAMIPAIMVLLACGHNNDVNHDTGVITIGYQWKFQIDIKDLNIILAVRSRLDELVNAVMTQHATFNVTHEQGRELGAYLLEVIEMQ